VWKFIEKLESNLRGEQGSRAAGVAGERATEPDNFIAGWKLI